MVEYSTINQNLNSVQIKVLKVIGRKTKEIHTFDCFVIIHSITLSNHPKNPKKGRWYVYLTYRRPLSC